MNFQIIPHGTDKYYEAVGLREEILRKPLGIAFSKDELEGEKDHIQVAGFDSSGKIISTAVLKIECKAYKRQRVAVSEDLQGKGIGSKMMLFCEKYAKEKGFSSIYCHARDSAIDFYLKNKYLPEGDHFDEDTIRHLKMRKNLN